MRAFLLYLAWLRWQWLLATARTFRSQLEVTITRERARAQHALEEAELEASRAEIAFLHARADRRISVLQKPTQGART